MNTFNCVSIVGGRLIDPANNIDEIADVHIQGKRVVAIGKVPNGFVADTVITARDQIVCPGIIDLAVRLREPGQEFKATIASETAAAAAAGITTMCCLPDTQPVIDTPAVVELIRQRAEMSGKTKILPIGALTHGLDGAILSEMAALRDAGCVAVSNIDLPLKTALIERRALEYATTFGLTCILQPIESSLRNCGCVHEGRIAAKLGLLGISEAAETVALSRSLILALQTGARVHFHALSSAAGANLFSRSLHQNPLLSADVAIHNLHLTEEHVDGFNSECHVIPPLRTLADRDTLRQKVAEGKIAAICSDHQPHEPDAKTNPFPATAPGISGLETLLPLTLRLVDEGVMSLFTAIERITWGAARSLGLPLSGRLDVGSIADVCVFDPSITWQIDKHKLLSRGHNTPFDDWTVRGRVNYTLVEGNIVFRYGA